jgi:hypothetical protein
MRLSRMYPLPESSAGAWWVINQHYQFVLLRGEQGWQLSCLAGGMSLLVKHDLLRRTYATRREAMQCLEGMLLSQEARLLPH